jgi:phosphatidylserine/phosphatidylglycerophosphate/cardiolipin synthase-like enzyme
MRALHLVLGLVLSASALASPIDGRLYRNTDGPLAIDLIREARSSIDLEIYSVEDPTVLRELERAALRGVRVRIVKDPTPVGGEVCPWFQNVPSKAPETAGEPDCSSIGHFLAVIEDNGGSIIPFDKARQCGKLPGDEDLQYAPYCYQHGKIMIVDRDRAWLSTGNLDESNLCLAGSDTPRCNRDFSWEIFDGSIVDSLRMVFEHDARDSTVDLGEVIRAGELDPRLTVSPYARRDLIDLIDGAKTSITLQNQYLKDFPMNDALIRAARRGVKVRVQVSSFCAFGKPSDKERPKIEKTYQMFDAAGIESRAFSSATTVRGRAGYLHAKWIVVDGERAWLGSINGSQTAIDRNREFGLHFTNRAAIDLLLDTFERDFTSEGSETWKESVACAKDWTDWNPPR